MRGNVVVQGSKAEERDPPSFNQLEFGGTVSTEGSFGFLVL